LYLPPYSPDLNPIEEALSKIKALLRRAEARHRGALVEATGRALSAVTARDARGFFEHCGYRVSPTSVKGAVDQQKPSRLRGYEKGRSLRRLRPK
jgi:transposase